MFNLELNSVVEVPSVCIWEEWASEQLENISMQAELNIENL